MSLPQLKSFFESTLSDDADPGKVLTKTQATSVFQFFSQCQLFRWHDANNDCEDRANAACILLNKWNIPNYKGWLFSGQFLKNKPGELTNGWKYHVAPLLPVKEGEVINFYIIDPATSQNLLSIHEWAEQLTHTASGYYFIKASEYYIFSSKKIKKDNWYKRNKRNYHWTMQGLSGINGVSATGRAKLAFNKKQIKATEEKFKKIKARNPFLQA